jgi:predicted PurR-regulated permease PerM
MNSVTTTGLGVVGSIFGGFALIVLVFYLLFEARRLFDEFLQLVPQARRAWVRDVAPEVIHKVSSWLGGHILLGFIMAT